MNIYIGGKERKPNPCRFSKKIVIFCIFFIVLYTIAQIAMSYFLKFELSPTLTTCVYAFFGTELCVSALIRVLDKQDKVQQSTTDMNSTNNVVTSDMNAVG